MSDPPPGSPAWCAAKLGFLAAALAKYRSLTGSKEFDELLRRDYRALSAGGDRSALVRSLRDAARALAVNFPGYTSEVRYTDRVLRFPRLFGKDVMFRRAVGDFKAPRCDLLYSTVTGDPGGAGYFPLNAVRWPTGRRTRIALTLPPRKLHKLRIRPQAR